MPGQFGPESGGQHLHNIHIERITALNNKITKARELLLNDDIDAADFKAIKLESEREINVLEANISELRSNNLSVTEVESVLDSALTKLTSIHIMYCESNNYNKRKIIGSIFPEKFTFENSKVRTAKKGEVFEYIYLINKELKGNKNGITNRSSVLSHKVIPLGFEPRTTTLKV